MCRFRRRPFDVSAGAGIRAGGTCSVTDGPFTEAKELIGGWALVRTSSIDEAVGWAKRFLRVVGVDGAESRIRQVFGPEDLPAIAG